MSDLPLNSPYLPIPPKVPSYSSYAIKMDFSTAAAIPTELEVLNVPLHDGQPYRLTVSNLPIQGPAGPGPIEVTVFERIGFETLARASFGGGHGQAETITGVGPVIVRGRALVANTNPQGDFFLTISPEIPKEIPPLSGIETVGAAFATIQLNAGFPPAYRSKLTVLADGGYNLRGIDSAGNTVFNSATMRVDVRAPLIFQPVQWSPLLRVQLQNQGGGGVTPATTAAVVWSRY